MILSMVGRGRTAVLVPSPSPHGWSGPVRCRHRWNRAASSSRGRSLSLLAGGAGRASGSLCGPRTRRARALLAVTTPRFPPPPPPLSSSFLLFLFFLTPFFPHATVPLLVRSCSYIPPPLLFSHSSSLYTRLPPVPCPVSPNRGSLQVPSKVWYPDDDQARPLRYRARTRSPGAPIGHAPVTSFYLLFPPAGNDLPPSHGMRKRSRPHDRPSA